MLGRSICIDTYIPIYVPILGFIRDWGREYLHIQSFEEI